MKGNYYRKISNIDRFARKFYCTHARLGTLRSEKRQARKAVRQDAKKSCRIFSDSTD